MCGEAISPDSRVMASALLSNQRGAVSTEANVLLVPLHFTIRITGRNEFVELQDPLKSMIFVTEYWIKLGEWKNDEAIALQPCTDFLDQVFRRKSPRVHDTLV